MFKIMKYVKRGAVAVGASALSVGMAMATPILENDALAGLPQYGTDIGDFLGNLTPGLLKFVFSMALVFAIIGVIVGAIAIAKKMLGRVGSQAR